MLKKKIYTLSALFFTAALLLTACGGNVDAETAIQTSVAETVAAQTPIVITETPAATLFPTQTPFTTPTLGTPIALVSPTTGAVTGGKAECAKASLQDETVVDGKIFKPGEEFVKTWYIKNESTCVWDTTYKIIFWSGDILGGGYYYQLPQVTGPGQTVPVSLVLTAPTTPGEYRSEWKLQTPDSIPYGVGVYQAAFYTEIEVANLTTTTAITYGIVDANLVITRDPPSGCQPANMVYTANVSITTNGPLTFKYTIRQQDGNSGNSTKVVMKEAGEYTNSDHVWKLGRAASQNSNRWMQLVITDPVYKEYPIVPFDFYCP
ncbi:MAG TPA: NBR1-Ig-like domain-containing protein [Anaerolineales bacterium]|nr:NBR1-Ig-like domain-containing protein [Anaerolineales bacterium]HNM36929.1 NBR1-Ig-like domain-containing protein [Anaerolineales bacterium]